MARSGVGRTAGVLLLSTVLAGCTTVRGGPQSVFDSAALVNAARSYTVEKVATHMPSDTTAQKQYRNQVIQAYLTAIDARYYQFRTDLSVEGRGGALGFDTVILALATIGSISTGSAPELAAATGFISGSRAAIDKNLLYEKTLPAIFAAMDAGRLRQRTVILKRMDDDLGAYPMEAAWSDLQNYQIAGTFDDAVTQITDSASGDRASARAAYNLSVGIACDATVDIIPLRSQVRSLLRPAFIKTQSADIATKANGRLEMIKIAMAFDVSTELNDIDLRDAINDKLEMGYCKSDILRERIDRILP